MLQKLVLCLRLYTGGREAGGSRSKNVLEGAMKANSSSGTQCEAGQSAQALTCMLNQHRRFSPEFPEMFDHCGDRGFRVIPTKSVI